MRQATSMESPHEPIVLICWQNSHGMWGGLTTRGRLSIGLSLDHGKAACIGERRHAGCQPSAG
jgi:hypothetical protein